MKKVLLIHPSQLFAPNWGKIYTAKPTLLMLFSFLKQRKGIDVNILDLEVEIGRPLNKDDLVKFRDKAKELISNHSFDIVGISCYTSLEYLSSIMIAEICKNLNSSCIVVVGGYHPSAIPSDFTYKDNPFDFVIIGEGELALLNICKGKKRNSGLTKIIQGQPLSMRSGIDLDWSNYKYIDTKKSDKVKLYLSRGCPFSCSFCMASSINQGWRSYSIDESVRQIEKIIGQLNPLQISFLDPCFGANNGWLREFLKRLIKKKWSKIFSAAPKIDRLKKEDIDLFAKLNFSLTLSLESGSERMIRIMNKARNPKRYLDRCREIIAYATKRRVPVQIPILLNHPGETHESFKQTIRYLRSLFLRCDKITSKIYPSPFYLNPGSPIYLNLSHYKNQYGMVVKEQCWWKVTDGRDHQELARDIVPSKDFKRKNIKEYWKKDILEIMSYCITNSSKEIHLFEIAKDLLRQREF